MKKITVNEHYFIAQMSMPYYTLFHTGCYEEGYAFKGHCGYTDLGLKDCNTCAASAPTEVRDKIKFLLDL